MINAITMKDGTVYNGDMSNLSNIECIFSSRGGSSFFLKTSTSGSFIKILDMNEIESVTIGNEIINLNY